MRNFCSCTTTQVNRKAAFCARKSRPDLARARRKFKFCADKDINIATYDLGYGDGLLRYAGDGELPLANGKAMLGKMSMDSFSCEDAGDWVCVFDDANVWARYFDTINYDILVKLSPNIKRKFV